VINGLAQQALGKASERWSLPPRSCGCRLRGAPGPASAQQRKQARMAALSWNGRSTLKVARLSCAASMMKVGLVGPTFAAPGVRLKATAETLKMKSPAGLVGIRVSSAGGTAAMGGRRWCLDLDAIALVRQESGPAAAGAAQHRRAACELQGLGFARAMSDQD